MFTPVEDEQQTEEHAAEVGEVGDAVGVEESLEQLEDVDAWARAETRRLLGL